jgi:hypothetical protein
MKKLNLIVALLAGMALTSLTTTASAAEAAKDVTVTGTALCAKCALHQGDKCQTIVKATVDGKDVTYYLVGKEAKSFHEQICTSKDGKKVTVSGKAAEKDGKEYLKATKIEEAK